MKLSQFFISRPIFAGVLSALIFLAGLIALPRLPISEYPEVVPPTVIVKANYPGANPKVIAETVASPLEQAINGVEGMLYQSSQATADGVMTLTITFSLNTDVDKAQVQVQNRVSQALPKLPDVVQRLGVVTNKASPDLTMVVHLVSPDNRYDTLYLSNYALLRVKDELARLDGVGDVQVFGAGQFSMRIWLDPEKVDSRNLTADDVIRAIREQNLQVAAGQLGAPPLPSSTEFQVAINAKGRLTTEDDFRNIIIKTGESGQITRLKDVARVELGADSYALRALLDNKAAAAIPIFQRPGSNAIAISEHVRAKMLELKRDFPQGVDYKIVYDPTVFVRGSIHAVVHTLFEAILLVVLVVIVFLQTWRASVIPLIAVPVSLVGTFAVMHVFGFSLNALSLFGLVLAIGIVVDDAIVVVENVERNIATGLAPREAARKSMNEVGSALIAIALVLCAVFVPSVFISGISGQFYRQFALTITGATIISLIVSLTLSPAMCALLLKAHDPAHRDRWWERPIHLGFGWFNRGFYAVGNGVSWLASRTVRRAAIMFVIYLVIIGFGLNQLRQTPVGFIPQVDRGYIIVVIQLPPGASLARTDAVQQRALDIAMGVPGVFHGVNVVGFSGATFTNAPNAGAIFLALDPFAERGRDPDQSLTAIQAELNRRLSKIQEAFIVAVVPPPVRGIGNAGGFRMIVEDRGGRGAAALREAATGLTDAAAKTPGLSQVFTLFETSTPQVYLDIDRTKAQLLGINVQDVFSALQIYIGSSYVNDFNLLGRTFRVTAQAREEDRRNIADVLKIRVRNASGETVPLGSFTTVRNIAGPYRVPRYNLYPAAEIDGMAAPGYSQGQAIDIMEKLAARTLPTGFDFEWTTLAFQQIKAGNTAMFAFGLAVVFVFLVLAAQYESLTLPLAVILIVPMCLVAAIIGVILRGQDNNILTQVGFVVLIGLAAKNAILIVEFARQLEDQGRSRWDAAVEATKLRLRPILMTSFAFILGVTPLVWAIGAGAELRQALGTAVFFGMIGVTAFGLIFTPVFYVIARYIAQLGRRRGRKSQSSPQPAE